MITSRDNPKVKWLRSLHEAKGRRQERCFLVEGVIQVSDALSAGLAPRLILYDAAALQATRRGRQLLDTLVTAPAEETEPQVVQSAGDTTTSQGIVAAFELPVAPAALPADGLVIVLDGIRDPGNAGTILRSAEAAGCVAVAATPDTADLFSPKVVRAGMGAHLRLPLLPDTSWPRLREILQGRAVYLAEASGATAYYDIDWTRPAALVVGNETEGPRPEAQQSADGRVSIPMPGRAESLNAAIAASIIIFEMVRQRALKRPSA